jgi:hypothetical protein
MSSMRSSSGASRVVSAAGSWLSSCSIVRGPMIAEVTAGWLTTNGFAMDPIRVVVGALAEGPDRAPRHHAQVGTLKPWSPRTNSRSPHDPPRQSHPRPSRPPFLRPPSGARPGRSNPRRPSAASCSRRCSSACGNRTARSRRSSFAPCALGERRGSTHEFHPGSRYVCDLARCVFRCVAQRNRHALRSPDGARTGSSPRPGQMDARPRTDRRRARNRRGTARCRRGPRRSGTRDRTGTARRRARRVRPLMQRREMVGHPDNDD